MQGLCTLSYLAISLHDQRKLLTTSPPATSHVRISSIRDECQLGHCAWPRQWCLIAPHDQLNHPLLPWTMSISTCGTSTTRSTKHWQPQWCIPSSKTNSGYSGLGKSCQMIFRMWFGGIFAMRPYQWPGPLETQQSLPEYVPWLHGTYELFLKFQIEWLAGAWQIYPRYEFSRIRTCGTSATLSLHSLDIKSLRKDEQVCHYKIKMYQQGMICPPKILLVQTKLWLFYKRLKQSCARLGKINTVISDPFWDTVCQPSKA